jgi:ABC-type transport system involved in cytochrome c biogenesis, permease component
MIRAARAMARKDLSLHLARKSVGMVQPVLLGLLLIFLFSLSLAVGETMSPQGAAAVFWMSTIFCQVFIFNTLYSHEENEGQRTALLLAPVPAQSIWLGKLAAGFIMLLFAQMVFFPAVLVFLGQRMNESWPLALGMLLAVNVGITVLGSLLGALAQGNSARESLFSVILFPLLVPVLLAGIQTFSTLFSTELPPPSGTSSSWFSIVLGFDAIYGAAALILFPHLFTADE